jgi:hypothetical protein
MDMDGCNRDRSAIGLDPCKFKLRGACGFPARYNFIIFCNLILNRNFQVKDDSQRPCNGLFINLQINAAIIGQITDKVWICQLIKDLSVTLVENFLIIAADKGFVIQFSHFNQASSETSTFPR